MLKILNYFYSNRGFSEHTQEYINFVTLFLIELILSFINNPLHIICCKNLDWSWHPETLLLYVETAEVPADTDVPQIHLS